MHKADPRVHGAAPRREHVEEVDHTVAREVVGAEVLLVLVRAELDLFESRLHATDEAQTVVAQVDAWHFPDFLEFF